MATNINLGDNTLYVNDIVYGVTSPGSTAGTTLSTQLSQSASVSLTAATYAPTALQSGATLVFNRAAGTTVTLPTPVIGTSYTFVVGTVATSNAQKIITSAGTIFLLGGLYFDKSLTITRYDGNGSTHISVNLNGTTTGGATIGDTFTITCVSATEWSVSGTVTASGTLATPFATS